RTPWGHEVEHTLQKGRTTKRREELAVERPSGSVHEQLDTVLTYAADGRVLSVDRPDGSRLSQCYADGQGCTQGGGSAGAGGDRLTKGNAVSSVQAATSQASQGSADYTEIVNGAAYQEDNQLRSMTDGEGRSVDLAVSRAGESDTAGFSAEKVSVGVEYDSYGRAKQATGGGAGGAISHLAYGADSSGRLGAGLISRIEQGSGKFWQQLSYDKAYNVNQVETSQGAQSHTDFDAWDRPVRSISGLSEDGRLATVGAAGCAEGTGAVVERAFDAAGHTVRERRLQDYVDPTDGGTKCRWVESRYSYNAREQLVSEEETHLASA